MQIIDVVSCLLSLIRLPLFSYHSLIISQQHEGKDSRLRLRTPLTFLVFLSSLGPKNKNKGKHSHPSSSSTQLTPFSSSTWEANLEGGAKGLALGAAIAGTTIYTLSRSYPKFRALPLTLKGAMCVTIVAPLTVFYAESAGAHYQQRMWQGVGKDLLDRDAEAEKQRWEALSTAQKAKEWAKENQWKLIGGG